MVIIYIDLKYLQFVIVELSCFLKGFKSLPNINKRPKGPHIVHLSTMCNLFEESAKADIFVY